MQMEEFLNVLASKEPIPGGGGVSALMGSLSAALCSMVANLTTGKKKYAAFEEDIQDVLKKAKEYQGNLYALIEKDAQAFKPLAEAYAIPKEDPNRDSIMEKALVGACEPPMQMMEETMKILDLLELLLEEGSVMAISDVGVAATAARAALEGAVMNIIINCNSMKDRFVAEELYQKAFVLLCAGRDRAQAVYNAVSMKLTKG